MRVKQSILVSKSCAGSRSAARALARKYVDRLYTVRETANWYRFRQTPPEQVDGKTYETETVSKCVKIIWADKKQSGKGVGQYAG